MLTYSQKPILGLPVSDFSLPGTDEKNYTLSNFKDKKILIIVFTCNHCPYARSAKTKLIKLFEKFNDQEVQFVAINPNDSESFPEDSFDKMREEKYNYPFPYLWDKSQEVARIFGAVCTPDIFVFDKERKLAYHGRIDDRRPGLPEVAANLIFKRKIKEKEAESKDLENAILALISDQKPPKDQKPSMGCSIKWKE